MRRTDEEIRLDWLVEEVGLRPSEARQYIKDNPKPATTAEAFHLFGVRWQELIAAVVRAFRGRKS